jgi:hypothetical protein
MFFSPTGTKTGTRRSAEIPESRSYLILWWVLAGLEPALIRGYLSFGSS